MSDLDWINDYFNNLHILKGKPNLICGLWVCSDGRMFVHRHDAEAYTMKIKPWIE